MSVPPSSEKVVSHGKGTVTSPLHTARSRPVHDALVLIDSSRADIRWKNLTARVAETEASLLRP